MRLVSNAKHLKLVLLSLFIHFSSLPLHAQPNYTANDIVPEFNTYFSFGVNPGSYAYAGGSQFWTDEQKAEIAVNGAGINSFRLPLFEFFLEQWSYDIRLSTFQYYKELGMRDHTVFIGFPSAEHRDDTEYCTGASSELFKNLYLPIWDNGANGTPYNDDNYYASYVYRMVEIYKDYTKYWEVGNEPDFTFTGNAFQPSGTPGSWWDEDPPACDLPNLKAPVYHYIRMLRISYELIKTLDPDAYVAIGGIGFPSFLHIVLRNTDNPIDGSVTADYPLTGGAYFDVVSYHSYPHINGSLRYWNNQIQNWTYTRHSEAATAGLFTLKQEFEQVLQEFGYGSTYPSKEWIITETNLPRKSIQESYGSNEAQRNFAMKSVILGMAEGIRQIDFFALGERMEETAVTEEWQLFNLMGLYKNLEGTAPGNEQITEEGIAFRTSAQMLGEKRYDATRTIEMAAPMGVRGVAFAADNGDRVYALWAKTEVDRSETASGSYQFPASLQAELANAEHLVLKYWDSSYSNDSLLLSPDQIINLSGTPVFVEVRGMRTLSTQQLAEQSKIRLFPNPVSTEVHLVSSKPLDNQTELILLGIGGREIIRKRLNGRMRFELPVGLEAGCYIVKIISANEVLGVARLVKISE